MSVSPPPLKRRRADVAAYTLSNAPKDMLSVCSWNVNGINPLLQPSIDHFFGRRDDGGASRASNPQYAPIRTFLQRNGCPTVCCLQEVKVRPDDTSTMRAVQKAVSPRTGSTSDDDVDYEAHFCLPSDSFNAKGYGGKLYGVCTLIRKNFAERHVDKVRHVDWDQEGRFLIIETKASDTIPKLAIFNVYMVNGSDHPYRDPGTGHVVGTRHHRKLQVHALLQNECRKVEREGFGIIIAGDINVARSPLDGHPNLRTFPRQHVLNRADFENRFLTPLLEGDKVENGTTSNKHHHSLAMIDTFRSLHPSKRSYTFYPRHASFGSSCDRVDMIIVCNKIHSCCIASETLETPQDRGPSDHVPIYAIFDYSTRHEQ